MFVYVAQVTLDEATSGVLVATSVWPARAVPEHVIEKYEIFRTPPPPPLMFAGESKTIDPLPVFFVTIWPPIVIGAPGGFGVMYCCVKSTTVYVNAELETVMLAIAVTACAR